MVCRPRSGELGSVGGDGQATGRLLALDTNVAMLLVDGPPGTSPVISANAGAGMALLVVESTVSGVPRSGGRGSCPADRRATVRAIQRG